jgi:hypothetical protein
MRRRQRHDAVLDERATDVDPRGFNVGARVEVDAPAARRLLLRGGAHFRLLRASRTPLAQLAQALGEPNLQLRQLLEIVVVGLAHLKAQRESCFRIVERETNHPVAARVAQKVGPEVLIRLLSADDEYPAALGRAALKLLLEPLEFVPAPA